MDTNMEINGGTVLVKYTGTEENVSIPEGVEYIAAEAFCRRESLRKISFPSSLKVIGRGAFSYCTNLEEISIPEGTVKIEKNGFFSCSSLEKVELPQTLISIGKHAFLGTKVEDSETIKEVLRRRRDMANYRKPIGWRELSFAEFRFYYSIEKTYQGDKAERVGLDKYVYDRDVADSQSVYRTEDGREALMVYVPVPTFDSDDREWDSYRKLFLFPDGGKMKGVIVHGGYRIAETIVYRKMLWADSATEQLLKSTGIFG